MDYFYDLLLGPYVVFFIFFLIGVIEIIVFMLIRRSARKKFQTWYETEASVVDVESSRGSKGGTVYYPVFEYKTYLGEEIRVRSVIGSSPNFYPVGTSVNLFYKPDDPKKFIIRGDKRFKLAGCIIGVVFGIFFLIGLCGIIYVAYISGVLG